MMALPAGIGGWPPMANISRWWRNRTETDSTSSKQTAGKDDLDSPPELTSASMTETRMATDYRPEAAYLLLRRMIELDLDCNEVARTEPQMFQDLQTICVSCDSRQQCARDLERNPDDVVWHDYCPNVAQLKMLSALPWSSRQEW
jgi:hypothetical protein